MLHYAKEYLNKILKLRELDSDNSGEDATDEEQSEEDDKIDNESIDSEFDSVEDIPPIRKRLKLSVTHLIIACGSTVKASGSGRSISIQGPSTFNVEIDVAAEEPGVFESFY